MKIFGGTVTGKEYGKPGRSLGYLHVQGTTIWKTTEIRKMEKRSQMGIEKP